jgi:hypothetical protein
MRGFALAAVIVLLPTYGWAAGAMMLPPPHPIAPPLPHKYESPSISMHDAVGACGPHRRYDVVAQKCKGPGDY